jgi:protein ImuB
MRTLVVWCPDWPVVAASVAAGVPATAPVAVVAANRVVASSAAARAEGVRRGLRRREAQSRCPDLAVIPHDPARDARAFEPVVTAVEAMAPGVEIVRPGVCAVAARGPARYYGGDAAAAARFAAHVTETCGVACQTGVADGPFAAELAAREGMIVPPGRSRDFLTPFPVATLDRPELADLLRRLGIRTLGAFGDLPARDVLVRFGPDGALAHRLARGLGHRPLAARRPPPDLAVQTEFEPPVERVDTAAFAARALAEELQARLRGHGLACARISIEARTEHGEELARVWRHDGVLTASAIADRVRWQLDGWLTSAENRRLDTGGGTDPPPSGDCPPPPRGAAPDNPKATPLPHRSRQSSPRSAPPRAPLGGGGGADGFRGDAGPLARGGRPGGGGDAGVGVPQAPGGARGGSAPPTAGITLLRLVPQQVMHHGGLQLGLWGGLGDDAERAHRAFDRIQGLLGPDAVVTAVQGGGRGPGEQIQLAPWGDERLSALPAGAPWPGRVPPPAPATVFTHPLPAQVIDSAGAPVGVTGRFAVTAAPDRVSVAGRQEIAVTAWAGPWPAEERWWDQQTARRRVRFQVVTADGAAWLLVLENGRWQAEAAYD